MERASQEGRQGQEPAASLRGLCAGYRGTQVLHDIDLQLPRGSTTLLIGPNGAGKTTLLKVLTGLLRPRKGSSQVMGLDSWKRRAALAEATAYFDDMAALPRRLPLGRLGAAMRRLQPRFRHGLFAQALAEAGIDPARTPTQLSKGQMVTAYLSLCIAVDADLLVLDEPTLGMDIVARARFRDQLHRQYLDGRRTALISTHYPEEVTELATHLCFLEAGRVVLHAPVEEALRRYRILPAPAGGEGAGQSLGSGGVAEVLVDLEEGGKGGGGKEGAEGRTPTVAELYIGLVEGAARNFQLLSEGPQERREKA